MSPKSPRNLGSEKHPTKEALEVAALLRAHQKRLVLAESCTGGLVSALLVEVPGISEWLCGSLVTYRDDSKVRWLNIPSEVLAKHSAVSSEVAGAMVRGALELTHEADFAAAITGHLGPGAPEGEDGLVFSAVGARGQPPRIEKFFLPREAHWARMSGNLRTLDTTSQAALRLRHERQMLASKHLLRMVRALLTGSARNGKNSKETR